MNKIQVCNYKGEHTVVQLPLVEEPYSGVFDSSGKQIMKYYDQTGREDWFVNPKDIINKRRTCLSILCPDCAKASTEKTLANSSLKEISHEK